MPPTGQPFVIAGPWGGQNDVPSAKHIPATDFVSTNNVVNRAGRIAPRPGREFLKTIFHKQENDGEIVSGTSSVLGIAVDTTNDKVYWSQAGTTVRRCDLDGSNAEDVITSLSGAWGVAVDPANGHVYVADANNTQILRADMTGVPDANVTTIQSSVTPRAMAIDTVSATPRLYWVNANTGFQRATLGVGDTVESFVPSPSVGSPPINGANNELTLDPANGYIYWTRSTFIHRCSMADGTGATTVHTADNAIRGIKYDSAGGFLYYTDFVAESLRRVKPDGTNDELVRKSGKIVTPTRVGIGSDGTDLWAYLSHDNQADIFRVNTGTSATIVSAFQWDRQLVDVDEEDDFLKDIVLIQYVDIDASTSGYAAWFRNDDEIHVLLTGYTAGSGTAPNIFAVNDRDRGNTKSSGIQFGDTSGRASFAAMGGGIDSGAGGVLVADGSSVYVFNYVLGDAIWTAAITGTPTGGTFTLSYNGVETASIAYNASAAAVKTALEALSAINNVIVTKSSSTFTIRFSGAWAGKDSDTLALDDNSLTGGTTPGVTVTQTQVGGTSTGSSMYIRPTGLPRPAAPSITAGSGSSGTLPDGQYTYLVTYYSTLWDIESPPSEISNYDGSDATQKITVAWTGLATEYFNTPASGTPIANGPLIDRVRIYRRRMGTDSGGSTPPDYQNADSNWFFIAQKPVGDTSYDDTGDTLDTSSPAPFQNEYPPANANYVEIVKDRAVYNSGRDMTLWHSEIPRQGGIANGELGFEYVSNESFSKPAPKEQTDAPITGLKEFGGLLYAGTARRVFAVSYDNVQFTGTASFQPLPGTLGFASHWCVVELSDLPDTTAGLLWMNPNGIAYLFDGVSTTPANLKVRSAAQNMPRQYWHDKAQFPETMAGWYWSTAVVDAVNNRAIFQITLFGTMVFCVDNPSWVQWEMQPSCLLLSRNPLSAAPQILLGYGDSEIHTLTDGKGDDGSAFDWEYVTKRFEILGGANPGKEDVAVFGFDVRNFGATDPSVTVTVDINDGKDQTATVAQEIDAARDYCARAGVGNTGVRNVQFTLAGSQADDQDHAELTSLTLNFRPTGQARQ